MSSALPRAFGSPTNSDPLRFAPSKKTVEVLAGMAKAMPKNDCRAYAAWVGVRNGMACVTNGFSALIHYSDEYQGVDVTFDKNLFPNGAKFPGFEHVMDGHGKRVSVDADTLMAFATLKGQAFKGLDLLLVVSEEKVSLEYRPKGKEGCGYFNPERIQDYLKAIPKGHRCVTAHMIGEMLRLEFTDEADAKPETGWRPTFTLIVVGVRAPE